ncbi:MAG: ABC transporter permease [Acidobacteria bacterium]|nr:ABC transporter permease [Acidobacteriota bacterium]
MNARAYALEAKYEFLKHARMPAYALPSITFPVMFYLLFGVTFGGGRPAGHHGCDLSARHLQHLRRHRRRTLRFRRWHRRRARPGLDDPERATPMPPFAYFLAKVAMAVLFVTIIILLLAAVGVTLGGVRLPALQWARLAFTLILGAVPFCAIGLALGAIGSGSGAPRGHTF